MVALALLATCATKTTTTGASAEYEAGWSDGCQSRLSVSGVDGYEQAYARDEDRYKTDAQYRDGWNTAFKRCAERPSPMMI